MRTLLRGLIIVLLAFPVAALAAADADSAASGDPVLEQARAATSRHDYAAAAAVLRDALGKTSENPEYHNLYAYALRKGANPDMDLVFKHYGEALRLEPKHRAAHEYIGEAYLMVGNVGKAKEHLARLDKLCFFGCPEYADLKKAIGEFEAKQQR